MGAARRVAVMDREPALTRACKAWRCQAVLIRGGLRRMGVHGPLRTLDESAAGTRGTAAPKGLAMWARELRAAGASREEVAERLAETARLIALAVCEDPEPAA